jgi:hypothetical protein
MTKPKNRETGPAPAAAGAATQDPPATQQPTTLDQGGGDQGGAGDEDEDDQDELDREAIRAAAPPVPVTTDARFADLVPEVSGRTDAVAVALLLEACEIYGVNPSKRAKPQELLAWRFYASPDESQPDAVTFVTGGGLKIKHWDDPAMPMDLDTIDRLRKTFGCYRIDPKTKEVTVLDLPQDLTLPRVSVDGVSGTTDHRYEGGYLRSGGKTAAAAKEERRQQRAKKLGLA